MDASPKKFKILYTYHMKSDVYVTVTQKDYQLTPKKKYVQIIQYQKGMFDITFHQTFSLS